MDTEVIPSKNPGMDAIRMPISFLQSRKASKREVSQYTILKDEKYFKAFKRNLLVTATTHDCEEILDGNDKPENNNDSKEIFK